MRTPYPVAAAFLALAFGIAGGIWLNHAAPPPSISAPLAMVVIPPAAPAPPPPPAPVVEKAPDLPTVDVAPHEIHTINENSALPIPTVTLHQKSGRTETLAPMQTAAASPPPSRPAPATSGAGFNVAGLPVHLFGVRPPDPRDRCGSGKASSCTDSARNAVASRLGGAGHVRCTVPAGQRGDPGYVCRDGAGVDLGGLLVSQGLALADTSSSYDYIGAQNAARSSRRGLWAYR
jgi:endonuclease YncB( thermonuclease family)